MPRKRIALGLLVALGALFLGVPAATALPPQFPPWEYTEPVYAPGGKTGWRAAHHLPGGAALTFPSRGYLGPYTRNGTQLALHLKISEPYVPAGGNPSVEVQMDVPICDPNRSPGCVVDDGIRSSVHVNLVALHCYNVGTRTERTVWRSGQEFNYLPQAAYSGYGHAMVIDIRNGVGLYNWSDTLTTDPFAGSGDRCNAATEMVSGLIIKVHVAPIGSTTPTQGSHLEWRADGWKQDLPDRPGLEECVLWFGEFYGPDWPERFDGKTPAEVGCDRWNRDPGDGFDSWCRDAPEATFFVLKSEAPFFGLEIGWIPSWIGHYAECLFNPREGFDTTAIGEAANDGWMGASRDILASVVADFGGGGAGAMMTPASGTAAPVMGGVTFADEDLARSFLGDALVDNLNDTQVPASPAAFGVSSTAGCGPFVEELPLIGEGVSSCSLAGVWPASFRTAAGALLMITAAFAALFAILRFMGVRYGWQTG